MEPALPITKKCSKCGEIKELGEFCRNKVKKDGLVGWCKECFSAWRKEYYQNNKGKIKERNIEYYQNNKEKIKEQKREYRGNNKEKLRERGLLRKYGITIEQWNQKLEEQGGCCASCGDKFTENNKPRVDHNHETGEVRGLLCHGCNASYGLLQETLHKIQCLEKYHLKWHPSN